MWLTKKNYCHTLYNYQKNKTNINIIFLFWIDFENYELKLIGLKPKKKLMYLKNTAISFYYYYYYYYYY